MNGASPQKNGVLGSYVDHRLNLFPAVDTVKLAAKVGCY